MKLILIFLHFHSHIYFFAVTVDEIETKCKRDDAGVLHCYKLYADSETIFWAKANCASLGQHLVTISSKEEFDFVTKYISERKADDYRPVG